MVGYGPPLLRVEFFHPRPADANQGAVTVTYVLIFCVREVQTLAILNTVPSAETGGVCSNAGGSVSCVIQRRVGTFTYMVWIRSP